MKPVGYNKKKKNILRDDENNNIEMKIITNWSGLLFNIYAYFKDNEVNMHWLACKIVLCLTSGFNRDL